MPTPSHSPRLQGQFGSFVSLKWLNPDRIIGLLMIYAVYDNFHVYKQLAVNLEPLTMFCMWAFSGWPGKLAKTVYGGALLSCLGWGGGVLRFLWSALLPLR